MITMNFRTHNSNSELPTWEWILNWSVSTIYAPLAVSTVQLYNYKNTNMGYNNPLSMHVIYTKKIAGFRSKER